MILIYWAKHKYLEENTKALLAAIKEHGVEVNAEEKIDTEAYMLMCWCLVRTLQDNVFTLG
jgi:hypothetical protein